MRFDLLTIFPEFFRSPFEQGVVGRALAKNIAEIHPQDLRRWTHDRHRTVDDRPYGGGEGMVLKAEPIAECLKSLSLSALEARSSSRERVILLSAQGQRFTQETARRLAGMERIVLICGRYEGVDERVAELMCDEELSIGDYVLSGGELAAAVIVDAVVRLLPSVLGHADSSRYESFGLGEPDDLHSAPETPDGVPRSTHGSGGLLDYPHYTRPATFLGSAIPEVLSGGDHHAIRRWRRGAALAKTLRNRPDLLAFADLSSSDRKFLAGLGYPVEPQSVPEKAP